MAVVGAGPVGDWLDAINQTGIVSVSQALSALLFVRWTKLSKTEEDKTFMISQPFQLRAFVIFGFYCPDSGVVLLDSGWLVTGHCVLLLVAIAIRL